MASDNRDEDQGRRTAADLASQSEATSSASTLPSSETSKPAGSVALLPEPFKVDAEAVDLAAAAARAALRRTTGAFGRFARPVHPQQHPSHVDPFRSAVEPLKAP